MYVGGYGQGRESERERGQARTQVASSCFSLNLFEKWGTHKGHFPVLYFNVIINRLKHHSLTCLSDPVAMAAHKALFDSCKINPIDYNNVFKKDIFFLFFFIFFSSLPHIHCTRKLDIVQVWCIVYNMYYLKTRSF